MTMQLASIEDLPELEQLYDALHHRLEQGPNYPGWRRGVYPVKETALKGIEAQTLYIAKQEGAVAGSVILNHESELAYEGAPWQIEADKENLFVVHTLVVHPQFSKLGVGGQLMEFARQEGMRQGMRAIRLDVYKGNLPAIRLYERSGYRYIANVDLGLGQYGLDEFRLYELLLP